MRQPASLITVAADSVGLLRRQHIFCVLDHCGDDELLPTADFIAGNRPDLADELAACLAIVSREREEKRKVLILRGTAVTK